MCTAIVKAVVPNSVLQPLYITVLQTKSVVRTNPPIYHGAPAAMLACNLTKNSVLFISSKVMDLTLHGPKQFTAIWPMGRRSR